MTSAVEKLAAQIEALRRQMRALGSTPQLPFSSIDSGAMTITTPGSGSTPQTSGIVGVQFDGTTGAITVAGPTPPVPAGLSAVQAVGGIKVIWDGTFADPQSGFASPVVAPQDFAGVNIQVSTDPSFPNATPSSSQGHITSAAGGEQFIASLNPGENLYIRLRTRSLPGKNSGPSQTVGPIVSGVPGSRIFLLPSSSPPPTPGDGFAAGDMWVKTDQGNAIYVWGNSVTVARSNLATNPDAQTTGNATFWQTTPGTGGTATGVLNSGTGAEGSTGYYHQTWSGAPTGVGGIITAPMVAVAAQHYSGSAWVRPNQDTVMSYGVTWLNAAGSTLSTSTGAQVQCPASTWTRVSLTNAVAPGSTASAQVTLYNAATGNPGAVNWKSTSTLDGDHLLFEPSAVLYDYFDGRSGGQARWDNVTDNSSSITWQEVTSGPLGWQARLIGTGAITDRAVTAELLEAYLVLASVVIAGDPSADHATMQSDGFHVYRALTGEGVVEVGHLATSGDNFLSIANSTGQKVATVDPTGLISGTNLNISGGARIGGTLISDSLFSKGGTMVASSYNNAYAISGITTEFGLGEVSFIQDQSRSYWIHLHLPHMYTDVANTDALITLRFTADGSSPTTSSLQFDATLFTMVNAASYAYSPGDIDAYGNFPAANGAKIRILATATSFAGGGHVNFTTSSGAAQRPWRMWVADMGPNIDDTYLFNDGSGGVTSKTRYSTGNISPSGSWSYTGSGTLRGDTTDIVQGSDPQGVNGDGKGGWDFTIPNISGTVNSVTLYIYSNHTGYPYGAHALIRPVSTAHTASPTALQSVFDPGVLYPDPGGIAIQLPTAWNSTFAGRTSIGLYLGPSSLVSGTGNPLYYMRADGPSARLVINYTQ